MTWDESGLTFILGDERLFLSTADLTAASAAVAALLLSYFVYRVLLSRGRRRCRWRRAAEGDRPPFSMWTCRRCRVDAFTTDGGRPKECKRMLKPLF